MHTVLYVLAGISVVGSLIFFVEANDLADLCAKQNNLFCDTAANLLVYLGIAGLVDAVIFGAFGRVVDVLQQMNVSMAGLVETQRNISTRPTLTSRESPPRAVSTTTGIDQDIESRWTALTKYDPEVRSAISELAQISVSAVDDLKTVYKTLRDPSALPNAARIIKEDYEKRKEELEKQKILLASFDDPMEKFNYLLEKHKNNLESFIHDSEEFDLFIEEIGLRVEKKDSLRGKKWIDVYDLSTGKKIKTMYFSKEIIEYITQYLSK